VPILDTAQSFLKAWDLEKSRIIRPARLVFLCGGVLNDRDAPPSSARDALLRRIGPGQLGGANVVLAETANNKLPESSFSNLLDLEEHIGAIVDSVILFVESPGSICELGAFCKIPEISSRLKTFVMNDHAIRSSFVRNGPLKYLRRADGHDNFSTFDWRIVDGKVEIEDFVLEEIFSESEDAAKSRPITESFDHGSSGHVTYTILAITFALRGGLLSEIKESARTIWPYITETQVRRSLDVLQIVELVEPVTNGKKTYYVPKIERLNLDVTISESAAIREPMRYLSDILTAIKDEDKNRLKIFGAHNGD
jgi:hypothetical protein